MTDIDDYQKVRAQYFAWQKDLQPEINLAEHLLKIESQLFALKDDLKQHRFLIFLAFSLIGLISLKDIILCFY